MKKLMSVMVALGLMLGTASLFAQDAPKEPEKKAGKKDGKKKKKAPKKDEAPK